MYHLLKRWKDCSLGLNKVMSSSFALPAQLALRESRSGDTFLLSLQLLRRRGMAAGGGRFSKFP